MAQYDATAPTFTRHRALPDDVAKAIRISILDALDATPHARLLDLGAGTGRIGSSFVASGDDYVGVDLSFGMLREFKCRAANNAPVLVHANGRALPFRDTAFDAVMLIQIFGGLLGWRTLVSEARRVLRPTGAIVVGRSVSPQDGIDAQMKRQLAALLGNIGVKPRATNVRNDVQRWLDQTASHSTHVVAAAWDAERTPRGFLERHRTGARFSMLPVEAQNEALRRLGEWAHRRFGSLDAVCCERHVFELQVYRFNRMDR